MYLDSIIDEQGGTEADVKARIGKARGGFIEIQRVVIIRRRFNSNVNSVLLYGAETWRRRNYNCLRKFLQIRWPDTISNVRSGVDWSHAPETSIN